MIPARIRRCRSPLLAFAAMLIAVDVRAQTVATEPFEPVSGRAGKDVVWVPTSDALVKKMLELAKLTPSDRLVDLGSGDGRTVIAAARLGAVARGIEFDPQMVALSERRAAEAGLGQKASFTRADIFETDFSDADVVTMFLLTTINVRLRPKILDMKPGTRIVSNTFTMDEWQPDATETLSNCQSWCTALLWIVPAKVEGTWTSPRGDLRLTQKFQQVSGTFGSDTISEGKLDGRILTFRTRDGRFRGDVDGNAINGTLTAGGRETNVYAMRER